MLGITAVLTLLGIFNVLSDMQYKLGHVVATDKGLQHVQGELGQIITKVEEIERAVSRIEDAQGAAPIDETDDD